MKITSLLVSITITFNLLSQVISFDNETINYFENGTIREKGKTLNGQKQGEWLTYYYTSQIKEKAKYNNGKLDGELLEFYANGNTKEKTPKQIIKIM